MWDGPDPISLGRCRTDLRQFPSRSSTVHQSSIDQTTTTRRKIWDGRDLSTKMRSDGPAGPPKGPQPGVTSRNFHVIDITTPVLSQLTVAFRIHISGKGYTGNKKMGESIGFRDASWGVVVVVTAAESPRTEWGLRRSTTWAARIGPQNL